MQVYDQLYINGIWAPAQSGNSIRVSNPANNEIIAEVATASIDQVNEAVDAAHQAFPEWSETPAEERSRLIKAIANLMMERRQQLAHVICEELGMPLKFCEPVQVVGPAQGMGSYASRAQRMDLVEKIGAVQVVREPIGVCALITPWNYPLHQIVGKCAPALAAGCTMVLKPSEITPLNAILFAEILDEVGVPKGVFNLIQGMGTPVGEALLQNSKVDMVSFTGSTPAGVRISELAAATVKRVCLELGGKSPFIITEGLPDLSTAVKYGVKDVLINSGQTCTALTRMLVHESDYDEAVQLAQQFAEGYKVGNPLESDTFLGPMSSCLQQQRVRDAIQTGLNEGARLVTGGLDLPAHLEAGAYICPTIFADVDNSMRIAREEIFGPVLCIMRYRDEAHAIEIANDSDYGLSSAVWSNNNDDAVRIAKRIRAGLVHVNGGQFSYEAPFGGYKKSGNGREWGDAGLDEYVETKAILF